MKNVPYEAAQARLQAARDDWAQKMHLQEDGLLMLQLIIMLKQEG
jgi:hypothetical protein